MSLLRGGDDILIKKLHGIIYALCTVGIIFVLWVLFGFAIIQFFPHKHKQLVCTYSYTVWRSDKFIAIDIPEWTHTCHG